jgi:hypothetical protein
MQSLINGIHRILGTEKSIEASESGAMFVVPSASQYEETTRGGYAFSVITTTATASVVALPTTAAGIGMWNSAPDGGRSIIIDALFADLIAATSNMLGQAGLIYYLGTAREATLTQALTPRKLNGLGPGSDTVAICAAGGAIMTSGAAIAWVPVGPTVRQTVKQLPGCVLWAPIDGKIIVSPGRHFGVNVMSMDAGATFNCGIMWHEKQLTTV